MKHLTIIVPYYNIRYFSQTLESLAKQSIPDFKVIIGNDNSPEDPINIIDNFKDRLDLTYLYFKDNLGKRDLTQHWKRCIDFVKTDWFLVLGDDDILSEKAVEGFYKTISKKHFDVNVLRFDVQVINGEGVKQSDIIRYVDGEKATTFIFKRAKNEVRSSLGEYVFRIEDYRKNGISFYPKAFYSDNLMVLKYSGFGSIKNIEDGFVQIRVSPHSLSGNINNMNDIAKAGYLFYTDLILNYKENFNVKQKFEFMKFVLAGYLTGTTSVTLIQIFQLIINELSWKGKIIFISKLVKNIIFNTIIFKRLKNRFQYWQNNIQYKQVCNSKIVKQQKKNPFKIPILIINFNQLNFLEQQINFLVDRGFENIVIVDNCSNYPPLMEYYKKLPKGVLLEKMNSNEGHMVFFNSKYLQKKYGQGYYVISDADIVPNSECPNLFMNELIDLLDKHNRDITKVGFALEIDDIPDTYPLKDKVINWERRFWIKEIEKEVYSANIDTTFALYKPCYPKKFKHIPFLAALRLGGDYICKHGGWYLNPKNLSNEEKYYQTHSSISNSWKIGTEGNLEGNFKDIY